MQPVSFHRMRRFALHSLNQVTGVTFFSINCINLKNIFSFMKQEQSDTRTFYIALFVCIYVCFLSCQ